MNKLSEKILKPLRVFAAVLAVAVVAVAACVAVAPERAWAADDAGIDAFPDEIKNYYSPNYFYKDTDGVYHVVGYGVDNKTADATRGWYNFAQASRFYQFEDAMVVLDGSINFEGIKNQDGWMAISGTGDNDAFTVGSEDRPFKGKFDGQSNTLYNFDNHRDGLALQLDCGFFGCAEEAVVKNISFEDCYVGATYRGGLVCGYAQDTLFMNITATNCTTSVIPPNNVINLITNAGMSGGMIVGEANGCTIYNCEMEGGRVVNNATSGVGALGGQPLYLGGLVGWCNDTVIEYSRVTDIETVGDDGTKTYTPASIENKYGTAVSVANFSELFTGGIVGGMKAQDSGSKIVDCYCTADVYSEACIYFGVGLGLGVTRGYTGGIAGIVQEGSEADGKDAADLNLIERVSFAGDLSSYNYNIILLGIPAIETDKYLGGITGRGGGNATIADAYYMRHTNGVGFGSDTTEDIYDYKTSYSGGVNDGVNFGDRDADYTDREFWEGCDFDFAGGTLRDLGYDFTAQVQDSEWKDEHYNKWVMDYDRGMPVHGGSIKATMDYPESGTVTIGTTSLSSNSETIPEEDRDWKTSDPYDFAVQGYEEGDTAIEITYDLATTAPANSSWGSDKRNEGYRFMGWYRSRDVQVNDIAENHDLFTEPNSALNTSEWEDGVITGGEVEKNSNYEQDSYTLQVVKPVTDEAHENDEKDYYDNDLYVAYAQAQALLHNTQGALVKHDGTEVEQNPAETDWYDYGATLTLPSKVAGDEQVVADGGTLVGWTMRANTEVGSNGAYTNATSSDLTTLKNDKVFFEVGTEFVVTEPTNLYPVYASLGSNVTVVFEGHDQDVANEGSDGNVDDISKRDGFGQAFVRTDTSTGETRYYVTIDDMTEWGSENGAVQNDNKITSKTSPISEDYDATDTGVTDGQLVRFLGWYETVPADDGAGAVGVRVSDQPTFYLDDVDLTQVHTYTAKFEYCVRYWWDADTAAATDATPYSLDWVTYDAQRHDPSLDGSNDHLENWLTGGNGSGVINSYDASSFQVSFNVTASTVEKIHYPFSFHGEWKKNGTLEYVETNVTTDFPTGPNFEYDFNGQSNDDLSVAMSMTTARENGFNFYLWSGESSASGLGAYRTATKDLNKNFGDAFITTNDPYWFKARLTADVKFHGADRSSDDGIITVERQYEDDVFMQNSAGAGTRTYYYHLHNNKEVKIDNTVQTVTIAASPTDESMERDGYIFLGWIDKNAISGAEFNYIFNGETIGNTDVKLVKDVTRAKPYIMDGTEVVRHPMDLYPVYTTFFVETDTNVNPDNTSLVDTNTYNIPNDPTITDGKIDEAAASLVKLNYNKEDGPLPDGSNPVDVTYTGTEEDNLGNVEAKIVVTANKDTKVWESGTPEDPYVLQSISVMVGDEVVETLTPDDAGSITYTIEAGVDYTFRANYSPVPVQVIYHLNDDGGDDDTDMHTVSVGDPLPSTNKVPTFDELDNAFHVGWVVGDESGQVTAWNDQLDLAEPGVDTVTGTTHLWPVYRQGSVTVKSNIDKNDGNDTTFRYTEVRGDSLYLVAKDVDGYRFEGWYTNYQNEGARKQLSSAYEYPLTGDARFDGTTYTAVYTNMAEVNQVQYHDTDGNVIYTAYAEGEDAHRTFLKEVTYDKPVFDEDGNPELDEDGNQETEQVTEKVIIDLDAFNIINAKLNEANSDTGADAYEEFVTWQWADNGEAEPERWGKNDDLNNFINEKVSDNVGKDSSSDHVMHLYPVTIKLTATAPADDGTGTPNYAGDLRVTELKRDDNDKLTSANVTLLEDYEKSWLKVNLTEYAYNKSTDSGTSGAASSVETPQTGVAVNLYAPNSSTSSPLATATTVASAVPDYDPVALEAGDALFIFNGRLVINKSAEEATDGQTFTFKVTDANKNTRLVPVTVHEVTDAEGKVTGYTGSSRLVLPYGEYTVSEDGWAWRYDSTLSADGVATSSDSVTVEVSYKGIASDGSPAATEVDCTNTLNSDLGDKWFDDNEFISNVFGGRDGE